MEKILFVAICIRVIFFIIKLVERKYLQDESPIKYVLRDTVYVALSSSFIVLILSSFEGTIDKFMNTLTGKV